MATPLIRRVFGAVNIGSFRISAMILGQSDDGELIVLGSSHRQSQGVRRGYITDAVLATYAIRDAFERAEKAAGANVSSVWVGCAGAGLASRISHVEIEIGGRRIDDEDIEQLLITARDNIEPHGRVVLHAQPAYYTLDGAHGVANPKGLYAERLGVDVHVMLADGPPIRNLIEAVQNAHLEVEGVVAAPLAASYACLSAEESELGTALVEIGGDVTTVSMFSQGMLHMLKTIPYGSSDMSDAIAGAFGIKRQQAERLKCVYGSAIVSPSDHREFLPLLSPEEGDAALRSVRGADDKGRIARADLIAIITGSLSGLCTDIGRALNEMGYTHKNGSQVVVTGGGSELAGVAEFMQSALGRSVRIGRVKPLIGLPEAHGTPGFAALAGLCLYAADDPIDIRKLGDRYQRVTEFQGSKFLTQLIKAFKDHF